MWWDVSWLCGSPCTHSSPPLTESRMQDVDLGLWHSPNSCLPLSRGYWPGSSGSVSSSQRLGLKAGGRSSPLVLMQGDAPHTSLSTLAFTLQEGAPISASPTVPHSQALIWKWPPGKPPGASWKSLSLCPSPPPIMLGLTLSDSKPFKAAKGGLVGDGGGCFRRSVVTLSLWALPLHSTGHSSHPTPVFLLVTGLGLW